MTQKIDAYGVGNLTPATRAKSAEVPAGSSAGVPVGKIEAGDSVRLTSDGLYMNQLHAALRETPAVSNSRVAQVRRALADGTYQVDPQAIAAKLMRFEWLLSGSAP